MSTPDTRSAFPLPDLGEPLTRGFWQAAARGELAVPRCAGCGAHCWYPRRECPGCDGTDLPWTQLAGTATLFSWTVVHHAFLPAYRDELPLVAALVTPDDAPGIRIATRVVDADPADLRVGQAVEVTFGALRHPDLGAEVTAPFFRPRSGGPR
ncbi:Zn-ribbon domain-containing OB-fold protein [Yinghuangia sp. YIM S09857]|uniref:Zn-ribbon domain-containing OB-fold protein n=1 Tax=Yinghuangia sp. YIM S09857 TaxID=3436929 RepID=UPI003F531795